MPDFKDITRDTHLNIFKQFEKRRLNLYDNTDSNFKSFLSRSFDQNLKIIAKGLLPNIISMQVEMNLRKKIK